VLCARAALNVEDRQVADRALSLLRGRAEVTPEIRLLEGYLAFLQQDYPRAFEAANQAAKLDGRLVPALCLKGRSAQAMGKLDEARIAYASALALDPSAPISASRVAELVPGPHCVAESGSQCFTPVANDKPGQPGRFAP
jgi:tetratricopeptide (TPR) repeat protein